MKNTWNTTVLPAIAVLAAIAVAPPVLAQKVKTPGPPTMTAVDLAVDWQSLVGTRVRVTGCSFSAADTSTVFCDINTPTGTAGFFSVDSPSMDRDDLRRAMNECADYAAQPSCAVTLEGNVEASYGELSLTNVDAEWVRP